MEIQPSAVGMGLGFGGPLFDGMSPRLAIYIIVNYSKNIFSSSMSPTQTPWNTATTPAYAGEWSPMMRLDCYLLQDHRI